MTVGETYVEWAYSQGRHITEQSRISTILIIDQLVKAEKERMARNFVRDMKFGRGNNINDPELMVKHIIES